MSFLWRGIRNYQANKASCRLRAASRKPQERKKKSKTRDGKARLEDHIAVVSELLGTNVYAHRVSAQSDRAKQGRCQSGHACTATYPGRWLNLGAMVALQNSRDSRKHGHHALQLTYVPYLRT
jgi:hypothetical protein